MSLQHDLRVIRALALNDVKVSLTDRVFVILGIVIPINFLLLFMAFALTGGQAPIAVVVQDQGPLARQFVAALAGAHSFIIEESTGEAADRSLREGRIVATITVPSGFDDDLRAGRPVVVPVLVNNLQTDFTNDIRRAVPLSITSFYAEAYPEQVVVQARETDVQAHDTGYIPYLAVSVVVLGLMLEGLLQAGMNSAREYETGTIKELILSPASRWAVTVGKILGSLILNVIAAVAVLFVVIVLLGIHPLFPGEVAAYGILLMVAFIALGTLVGTIVRRRQAAVPLSLATTLPLFFMSGPFGPPNWLGPVAGSLAKVSPLYYAIAIFQHAFHGYQTSQSSALANTLALLGFAAVAIWLTTFVLRRSEVAR